MGKALDVRNKTDKANYIFKIECLIFRLSFKKICLQLFMLNQMHRVEDCIMRIQL